MTRASARRTGVGFAHDRQSRLPEVRRSEFLLLPIVGDRHGDDRRSRICPASRKAAETPGPGRTIPVRDGAQRGEDGQRVGLRVERADLRLPPRSRFRVCHSDSFSWMCPASGSITREGRRWRGAVDGAAKPVPHEFGAAGVVDVGVGGEDEVDRRGRDRHPRAFFRSLSTPPWNNPQSTRNRLRAVCTRMQEPVTSAPRPGTSG